MTEDTREGNSEAQRGAETPTVFTTMTAFAVSCLPYDDLDSDAFTIRVVYTGRDRWAVRNGGYCLGTDSDWDWEPIPSERDDDWLAAHRFDLDTALRLAREHAPRVTVNGHTVQQMLEVKLS